MAKGGRMGEIEKGLAKLDATVAEIKKVTTRTGQRATKKATKAAETVIEAVTGPKGKTAPARRRR